jgi:hypothetical protein
MGGESISKTESIPQIKKSVTMDNDSVNKQSTLSLTEAIDNVVEPPEKETDDYFSNVDYKNDEPMEIVKSNGDIKDGGKSGEKINSCLYKVIDHAPFYFWTYPHQYYFHIPIPTL